MAMIQISGQEPVVEQLPTAPQSEHPESVTDTSVAYSSRIGILHPDYPSYVPAGDMVKREPRVKEERKSVLHIDSLFRKEVSSKESTDKRTVDYPLIIKYFNPIKFFLHITALKK